MPTAVARLAQLIHGCQTQMRVMESPMSSLQKIIDSLQVAVNRLPPDPAPSAPALKPIRRVDTDRGVVTGGNVGSPDVATRLRFATCLGDLSSSPGNNTGNIDTFNQNYSAFDPDKPPRHTTRRDTISETEKLDTMFKCVRDLSTTTQSSFVTLHAQLAMMHDRVSKIEGLPAAQGSGHPLLSAMRAPQPHLLLPMSNRVSQAEGLPAAQRSGHPPLSAMRAPQPHLLHTGLYPPPFTQQLDGDGRYVQPLVGAGLTANRGSTKEGWPTPAERVELGAGTDTPGRPGSKLPGNPDRPFLAPAPLGSLDSSRVAPSSGLNLAYLMVVSHTVLSPNGEQFQLDQHLIGDQWLPLCTGRTRSPMLGKALMQFGVRMDDRPFDPIIVERDALLQRARDLFYTPIISSLEETRTAVPELQHISQDSLAAARDLVTLAVSHPERWPLDWVVMNAPDYFVLVRIHAGFDRDMYGQLMRVYHMTTLRQQLSLVRHTIAYALQHLGVHVTAVTSSLSGRRTLAYLDSVYESSETERVPINLLVQMSAQKPSLYDTDVSVGRPVRLPPGDGGSEYEERAQSHAAPRNGSDQRYSRVPELKNALCVQLTKIEPAQLKTWSKGSIQYWNLRTIHAFTHGVMKCMIPMLLAHGAVNAYEALKTLVIERVGDRFPHFIDVYTYPNFVTLLSDTIAKQAVDMQEVMAVTDDGSVQGQQRRAEQFVQGLCRILLVIRSIPYSTTLDEMARSEMKRLQAIKRPDGISDPQWWTDVARRFRSWLTLEGRETMAQAGSEIRDFLHAMLTQIADRHMRNEIIRLSNTWVAGLPAHFNKPSLSALLQYDIAPTTRAPVYPTIAGLQSLAPTSAVFEKSQDLRQIHDMGEALRKQGYPTSGPELTHLLLDFTVKYVGEHGAAAALTGQPSDSHVLMLRSEAAGPDGVLDAIVLVNDILYTSNPWPDIRSGIPDVLPPVHRTQCQSSGASAQKILFSDEPVSATPHTSTPALSFNANLPAPPPWDVESKRLEKMITSTSDHLSTQLAHFGDLIRTQMQMVAPPTHRHAMPQQSSGVSRSLLADTEHDADKSRKNLGGGGGGWPKGSARSTPQQTGERGQMPNRGQNRNGMRYMDKPAIRYDELSEAAKTHLASALGIQTEADWNAKSNAICPLCLEKNHLLNRCLSMWCCTTQGIKFFGADKAAQRFRKALSEKRAAPLNLADILAVYESTCEDCDPDGHEHVYDGFQMLIDESQILGMICDRTIDTYDPVFAVHEFDHARDVFLSKCTLK